MFKEEYAAMVGAANKKVAFMDNKPAGYMVLSMIAGAFIGLGVMIMSVTGAYAAGTPYVKLMMGAVFASALSLVVMSGGELFTGNNMVIFAGWLRGEVAMGRMLKLWALCFIGNWIGSIAVSLLFVGSAIPVDIVSDFMVNASAGKMALPVGTLLCKAIFCNIMVCLGVWCTFKCRSESGKLIMIFWCILIFVACGGEHTVANMTMLTVGMLKGAGTAGITWGGYFYNILVAAIGNIIGGAICIALPYGFVSRD